MCWIYINHLRFPFHSANFERKLGFHIVFSQVHSIRGVSLITVKWLIVSRVLCAKVVKEQKSICITAADATFVSD